MFVLERARNIDIGKIRAGIRWRLSYQGFFIARNRHQLFFKQESLEFFQLQPGRFHRTARRLAVRHKGKAAANAFTRGKFRAGFTQRKLVVFHVCLADGLEFFQRDIDAFRVVNHLAEQFRPQGVVLCRRTEIGFQPFRQPCHCGRSRSVCRGKFSLQVFILDSGKYKRHIAAEKIRETTEGIDAVLQAGPRHRHAQVGPDLFHGPGKVLCIAGV